MSERTPVMIKPLSPGELAKEYNVSLYTFNKWLEPHQTSIGERVGLYFTVLQVKIIYEKLGVPGKYDIG